MNDCLEISELSRILRQVLRELHAIDDAINDYIGKQLGNRSDAMRPV